jgi:Zn-dependent protease/CBS domain-containing protein
MSGILGSGGSGGLSFRLGAIPVSMPWSGLLGVGLIAYFWLDSFTVSSGDSGQGLLLALVFAVLFYVSILGHELAHAWSAGALGYPVHSITLWFLGGYTSYSRRSGSAWREGVIAASGPLSSLAIGFVARAVAYSDAVTDERLFQVLIALGVANIFLGAYNALPGLPLDGGAVLKSVVWGISGDERRGTIVAAWSGRVVAVAAIGVPVYLALARGRQPDITTLLFTGLVAWWLWSGASQALRQAEVQGRLPNLTARALHRPVVLVAHDVPLAEALRRRADQSAGGIVVVDPTGRATAVAQEAAVSAVPEDRRPWVPVSSVSAALDPRSVLSADLSGEALLEAMSLVPSSDYLVRDVDGTLLGVLTTADVERALRG